MTFAPTHRRRNVLPTSLLAAVTTAAIALTLLVGAGPGAASARPTDHFPRIASTHATKPAITIGHLLPQFKSVFEKKVAGRPFALDCTYAAHGAEGLAQPAWHGLPAQIYVQPYVCADINALASGRTLSAAAALATSKAILVMVHEAVHVSTFAGARSEPRTECRAVQLVDQTSRDLGLTPPASLKMATGALIAHRDLLDSYPIYRDPSCPVGGTTTAANVATP